MTTIIHAIQSRGSSEESTESPEVLVKVGFMLKLERVAKVVNAPLPTPLQREREWQSHEKE